MTEEAVKEKKKIGRPRKPRPEDIPMAKLSLEISKETESSIQALGSLFNLNTREVIELAISRWKTDIVQNYKVS